MLKWILLLSMIFSGSTSVAAAAHGAAPSIPGFATFLHSTLFFEQFNSTNNIDLAQTVPPGKNWYIANQPYLQNLMTCPSLTAPSPSWFTAANGVLNISTNVASCAGGEVMSLGWNNNTQTATHTFSIPGSGGFYIEGNMQFIPASNTGDTPDFWMEDINLMTESFEGIGGPVACEIDMFESVSSPGNSNAVTSTVHATGSQSGGGNASAIDFTKFHKWGALLTTMAQGGGTGSVQFYVDRVAFGSPITWTSGSAFSSCETSTYEINFAAQSAPNPLNVNYIVVFGP